MKKISALIMAFIMLLTITSFGAKIDEKEVKSLMSGGITLVSLSDVAESLDLKFTASSGTYSVKERCEDPKELSFSSEDLSVAHARWYEIGKNGAEVVVAYEDVLLPTPAMFFEGKLYVPYRMALEFFDARVYWSKEKGAYAYRTNYGKPTLIKTNGDVREVVEDVKDFESVIIYSDRYIYIKDGNLYSKGINDGAEISLGKAGTVHRAGDKLFVLSSGNLRTVNMYTGKSKDISSGITLVGYTADNYAWCESEDEIMVYDQDGNLIEKITGKFENSWEYYDGKVYYRTKTGAMMRANPDGTDEEFLIKLALYPEWREGYIYYTDEAGNYRRFSVATKEDIMVYGLNLEYILTLPSGKQLLNFYGDANGRIFISNPDGTEFAPYGEEDILSSSNPQLAEEGVVVLNQIDNLIYHVDKDSAEKLSDDEAKALCGFYDGFAYYIIK